MTGIVESLCENGWGQLDLSTIRTYLLIADHEGISRQELMTISPMSERQTTRHVTSLHRARLIKSERFGQYNESRGQKHVSSRYFAIGPT